MHVTDILICRGQKVNLSTLASNLHAEPDITHWSCTTDSRCMYIDACVLPVLYVLLVSREICQ